MTKIATTIDNLLAEIERARQAETIDLSGPYINDLAKAIERLALADSHNAHTRIALDEFYGAEDDDEPNGFPGKGSTTYH